MPRPTPTGDPGINFTGAPTSARQTQNNAFNAVYDAAATGNMGTVQQVAGPAGISVGSVVNPAQGQNDAWNRIYDAFGAGDLDKAKAAAAAAGTSVGVQAAPPERPAGPTSAQLAAMQGRGGVATDFGLTQTVTPPPEEEIWWKPGQFRTQQDEIDWYAERARLGDERQAFIDHTNKVSFEPTPAPPPVAVAKPVAGLGPSTALAARTASREGFDDPGVRETSKDLLRTIIGESEMRGQAAANALQRPQLTTQANDLLSQLLMGDGNDPITQSLMADFEHSAGRARDQQIEDLQRFGVLGGDQGPSAGFTADILGEFDSGIERGRSGVRAGGFDRLLNSVLPQATSLGSQQFGQDLTRLQLQQDVANQSQARRMPLTGPTGDQAFQESVRQSGIGNNFQQQGIDLQRGSLTGQVRDPETGVLMDTLGARSLNQQGSQFDQSLDLQRALGMGGLDLQRANVTGQYRDPETGVMQDTLGRQQLNQQGSQFDRNLQQQGSQFDRSAGQTDTQIANQSAQFAESMGLNYAQLSQQDRQFIDQLAQQSGQFEKGLGLNYQQLAEQRAGRTQQANQFDAGLIQNSHQFNKTLEQELARLLGTTTDGDRTLQGQQLDSANTQLGRENELDRIAQIIKAVQADTEGFGGIDVGELLRTLLQIPSNEPVIEGKEGGEGGITVADFLAGASNPQNIKQTTQNGRTVLYDATTNQVVGVVVDGMVSPVMNF